MPAIWERLLGVAGTQRGYVTAADAVELNVNPAELRKLAARGRLMRVAQGLYRFTTWPAARHDDLMEAVLWAGGRGVVSHDTALELHGLCDVNPRRIDITVPAAYRPRKAGGERFRVWQRDLGAQDLDEVEGIPVVTPAKAIEDGIRHGLTPTLAEQAITTARERRLITGEQDWELRRLAAKRQLEALASE